jgi:hypothetical protein
MKIKQLILFLIFIAFNHFLNAQSVSISSSASGAICAGTNVTFTATTSSISTPSYQWYKNGVAINGATASTYTTNSLTNGDVIKASAGDVIVSNGLIQNLDANNASSYTSGNTWNDLTGNGNNGTINTLSTGSVTIATEGNIKSFNYTKGLSYISAPLSKSASMTFNVWAKTSNLTNYNTGTMLFNAGASGTGPLSGGPDLFIAANKIYWNIYDAAANPFKLNGNDVTTTTASINDNNWHYFTVVVNEAATIASLYIDGVFKGSAIYKDPKSYSASALFIGGEGNNAHVTNYNLAWEGNISIFYSYNRALSTNEVVQNFNSKAAFYSASSSALITSNTITVSVSPITPSITIKGDGCIYKTTLTTATGLSSYQWIKDNQAISGATSNTYTPSTSGDYQVQVSNGTCSNISSATTIYTCAVDAYGKSVATSNVNSIISTEGGANFGTGRDISGKLYNTIGLTTNSGTIGSTTAILGGVISPTNVKNTSIGVLYSTDSYFGTYSSTSIQSNVAAGTYTVIITGLSGLTTYFAKSFVINKAGTSYGSVVSFTTSTPPKAVGDSYGGGKIFYILKSGDAGYDANIQHGLIAATSDQYTGNIPWSKNTILIGNTSQLIGSGLANTTRIISLQGNTGNYAAKIARDYISNGYSDWYLPSVNEMKELIAQRAIVGGFTLNSYYWTSSEYTTNLAQTDGSTYANTAWIQQNQSIIPVPGEAGKTYGNVAVRPIRSF